MWGMQAIGRNIQYILNPFLWVTVLQGIFSLLVLIHYSIAMSLSLNSLYSSTQSIRLIAVKFILP